MIFLVGWMALGLIAEALYLTFMKKRYPGFKPFNRDMFPVEIVMCLLAGPVSFMSLAVICSAMED